MDVKDEGHQSTRGHSPCNPKSLITFSHTSIWILNWAVMRDIQQYFATPCTCTVKTFNYCTSRSNAWHRQVFFIFKCYLFKLPTSCTNVHGYKHIKKISRHINDSRIRSTFNCGVIGLPKPRKTGWQSGVRSSIKPGLLAHLVQELKTGTAVPLDYQRHARMKTVAAISQNKLQDRYEKPPEVLICRVLDILIFRQIKKTLPL